MMNIALPLTWSDIFDFTAIDERLSRRLEDAQRSPRRIGPSPTAYLRALPDGTDVLSHLLCASESRQEVSRDSTTKGRVETIGWERPIMLNLSRPVEQNWVDPEPNIEYKRIASDVNCVLRTRTISALEFVRDKCPEAYHFTTFWTWEVVFYETVNGIGGFRSRSPERYPFRTVLGNVLDLNDEHLLLAEALVHEAIHSYLDTTEFCSEPPNGGAHEGWMSQSIRENPNALIRSPWTKRELHYHAFVHAVFVWYGLLTFWLRAIESADEGEQNWMRAAITRTYLGFQGALQPWQEIRDYIKSDDVVASIEQVFETTTDAHADF